MTDILEELKHRADLLDQAEQEMDLEPSEKESLFFVRVIAHIRGLMQQAETDRDFIQQYQQQVGALKVERDKLIHAVADHVTVRAEQRAEIERLEALHHSTNRELWSALDRMEDAKQERDALRSQRDRVTWALEHLLERGIEPPDRNCSCHISPPCNDCVEWSGLREAVEHAESALAAVGNHTCWQPIETAPRQTELLVGRYVNGEWRICQSGLYFEPQNEFDGNGGYWFWHCDWDNGGVTDEAPTHWMPLFTPPNLPAESKPVKTCSVLGILRHPDIGGFAMCSMHCVGNTCGSNDFCEHQTPASSPAGEGGDRG